MVVVVFVGGVIALSSLFLIVRGLFGARQLEVQTTLVASPVKSLLVGALVAGVGFGVFVGLGATGVPPLVVIALIVAGSAGLTAAFGLATVANVVGERVLALRERESSPFAQTSVGTAVLSITAALPFLGWFVIGPLAVLFGLGAVVLTVRRRSAGRRGRGVALRGLSQGPASGKSLDAPLAPLPVARPSASRHADNTVSWR